MSRSRCPWIALVALIACASPAFALEPGTILIGANLTTGSADFVTGDGTFLSAYEHGEVGAGLETWYFLDDDMAFTLSGGIGKFREKQTAGTDQKRFYTQSSWNARVGLDHVIDFSREAMLFFGPGVEYWSGHAKFEGFAGTSDEDTPDVMRISLSGRFGGMVILGDAYGLTGRIGYRMGWARAKDGDAETTWFPNGFDAAAGFVYSF